MKLTARILVLILTVALAATTLAQETTTTAADTTTTTAAAETDKAPSPAESEVEGARRYELRNAFTRVLNDHPRDVSMILTLDPSLMSNAAFVAKYPELQSFLEKHPEVRRNPQFYVGEFGTPGRQTPMEGVVEMLAVLGGFALGVFAITWLIRTIIEQRRWNRLSRTQAEVHNKILDRFGSSEEVLSYIQTAAGTKFLESAPIPVQSARAAQPAPFGRVMNSVQLGVVIAIGALGVLLVSLRFEGDGGHGLFAMGAIAFSIGIGFIVSAVVSVAMSRRLGLWQGSESDELKEPGIVR